MDTINISIKDDFTDTPGSRAREEGDFSGEDFREKVLEPLMDKGMPVGTKILVDLDGTMGYGTSFLEEVFGGLARKYGVENIQGILSFKSDEEPYLIDDINSYIDNAKK